MSNLSRSEPGSVALLRALTEEDAKVTLYQLVDILGRIGYNKNADYHYLATVFSNMSQLQAARLLFLDREKCIIPRLLPYTQSESLTKRGGVVGLLRNLCFQVGQCYYTAFNMIVHSHITYSQCLKLAVRGAF